MSDSKVLCQNILGRWWTNSINKTNLWAEIININSAALKPQELDVLQLRGRIQTDDVGATVFKKDRIQSTDTLVFKVLQ
ncbi:hypothetical protein G6F37_010040 [Rhizopus arrhizus]|nr:hypothetical protein G6F38_010119 [Rhizopus arrhizus]KAG1153789.1 hypothetical protein G6F37_010040 [Rhizopus arrhizus]